jgi:putative transcriptional regulator
MNAPSTSLAGQLLIAMPSLADPNFEHTVVLLSVHSAEDGAFGLVINRPLQVDPGEVLAGLGDQLKPVRLPQVMFGGPVEPSHGFVLFEPEEEPQDDHAVDIDGTVKVTGNAETLAALVEGSLHGSYYLLLGYSGWAPGQLEQEIEENSWLVAPLDRRILFDVPPEERWQASLRSLGVDPGTLVSLGTGTPS